MLLNAVRRAVLLRLLACLLTSGGRGTLPLVGWEIANCQAEPERVRPDFTGLPSGSAARSDGRRRRRAAGGGAKMGRRASLLLSTTTTTTTTIRTVHSARPPRSVSSAATAAREVRRSLAARARQRGALIRSSERGDGTQLGLIGVGRLGDALCGRLGRVAQRRRRLWPASQPATGRRRASSIHEGASQSCTRRAPCRNTTREAAVN